MTSSLDTWLPDPGDVVIEVPAVARSLRVVRLVAATVAAGAGFDVDAVDDVRMAVDELCAAIVESRPASPLRVSVRVQRDRLLVRADAPQPASGGAAVVDRLRSAVLGATADDHRFAHVGGHSIGWMEKRSVAAPAAVVQPDP